MSEGERRVLVVGGGISGIQCALDLADMGIRVLVLERSPVPGGLVSRLEKTFPTHDCAYCLLEPKLLDVASNPNIEVLTGRTISKVEGRAGDFRVTVRSEGWYIDTERCTDCLKCIEVCGPRAISRHMVPLSQIVPSGRDGPLETAPIYSIDPERCTDCRRCLEACGEGAIVHEEEPDTDVLDAAAMVLAPGSRSFDPTLLPEFGYGIHPNVMTGLELEEMLSLPGPTAALLRRPSDGRVPERVAFIQCVGSRDQRSNPYCSSVCCMAAIKESILLVERFGIGPPTVFHMDIRSHGKEYEDYYNIARQRYGVLFKNARVSDIEGLEDGGLRVRYTGEDGSPATESFDLVVLSTGLVPPANATGLSRATGVELDEHGFMSTEHLDPLCSNVEGIIGCGPFLMPKDIPDSVSDASGAAMLASAFCPRGKGSGTGEDDEPSTPRTFKDPGAGTRIGVYICPCGGEVAQVVDIPGLIEYAEGLEGVVRVKEIGDMCTSGGQEELLSDVEANEVNRIVLASCSPRLLEPVLRRTLRRAGMNPFLLEIANIREQCAWVHDDPGDASSMARTLLRVAVAKVSEDLPLDLMEMEVRRSALVLGGGLSGMTAALALAEAGFEAIIVEKGSELGGHLRHIGHLFEGQGDPQQHLEELVERVEGSPGIEVLLGSTLRDLDGVPGRFVSTISGPEGERSIEHGAVIVATGAVEYEPDEYLYGQDPRVRTQTELEAMISEGRIGQGRNRTAVMIQCIGARNDENPNCSRICCSVAVKNALRLKELDPDMEIFVLNKDVRTYGFSEEWYRLARSKGVHFIRYDDENLPEVTTGGDGLDVSLLDRVLGKRISISTDLLVLSTATVPNPDNEDLARKLRIPISRDGFLLEAHMKLRPVDTSSEGIFLCGLAHGPKNIAESTVQARAAASHATRLLSKGHVLGEVIIAEVDPAKCRGCGRCVEGCEYAAIGLITESVGGVERQISRVDPLRCRGCGKCSVICCNKSISMRHFGTAQIERMIGAALEED